MTATKALTIVGVCLAAGAVLGGAVGLFIGTAFPGAYGWAPQRDPVHVGVGLGIPQGMALGAFIGVCVTGILAWHDAKTRSRPPAGYDAGDE
jgi:hypothetical protein